MNCWPAGHNYDRNMAVSHAIHMPVILNWNGYVMKFNYTSSNYEEPI